MGTSQFEFEERDIVQPQGFIGGYLHYGEPEFIQVGSEPNQGYYRKPANVVQEMYVKNLIVDKASLFIVKRMRPGATWGNGIQYLELGSGVGVGTTQAPQGENTAQTVLRTPLARKAIGSWTYLDANGTPTATETNTIQLTTIFSATEGNGALVEMGLFGGDATATLGSGYMFNYKTFPVWNKQSGMTLTVVWKLVF